ncbi:MAG: 30S ribosomal protein S20 [Bacillota bacterium]
MPNIKSAIKRVKVARSKNLQNTAKKSALKTAIKKCNEAIRQNDENASSILSATMKIIDKAAAKNVIHKNTAARRKSKLAKALNAVSK